MRVKIIKIITEPELKCFEKALDVQKYLPGKNFKLSGTG